MKIIVDSTYCVVSIEYEDDARDTKMTIGIKSEMSLTNDECKKEEA